MIIHSAKRSKFIITWCACTQLAFLKSSKLEVGVRGYPYSRKPDNRATNNFSALRFHSADRTRKGLLARPATPYTATRWQQNSSKGGSRQTSITMEDTLNSMDTNLTSFWQPVGSGHETKLTVHYTKVYVNITS